MANKKITQLNTVDSAIGIGSESMFPVASGSPTDTYLTSKVSAVDIAKYVLNPMPVGGSTDLSSIGFTGSSNIKFKKTNWENASTNVAVNPYLQVRLDDGQLITGSGAAVPAALGDEMGNCTATEDLKMQGHNIIRANEIYFGGTSSDDYAVIDYSYYAGSPQLTILKIRSDDLTLSGTRHVSISGQALDLASTPISGDVTITGGDLEIDPANKLIVNEISTYTMATADDPAILSISGSARFFTWETDAPFEGGASGNVDWKDSNVQFDSTSSAINYYFKNVRDGQTMTMYVQNTHSSTSFTPTFTNESDWGNGLGGNDYYAPPVPVLWSFPTGDTVAAMKEPPLLAAGTTNVYTFVNIKTGIFAAAITGYVY